MSGCFIHYGSDEFNPMYFTPIRNNAGFPKPEGGLWASRGCPVHEDGWTNYGWKEWCEDSNYQKKKLKKSFRFELREGARIVLLSDPKDLIPLPKTKPWELKEVSLTDSKKPTLEQLEEYFRPNPCFLDYEKMLREGVDAIELQHSLAFRRCLDTWDCDCIVVMNPDVIIPKPNV